MTPSEVSDDIQGILADIENEVYRNEQMIKKSIALEYLIALVDPKYKEQFQLAEKKARTFEDINRLLELAKKHIGQKTAITLLGI